MTLTYSEDNIIITSNWEKAWIKLILSSWLPKRLRDRLERDIYNYSKKKYGRRNDLMRLTILDKYKISVGKFTYGHEKLCYLGSKILEIGAFTSIGKPVSISPGNHPTTTISTHPFFYLEEFGLTKKDYFDLSNKNGAISIGHDVWIGMNVTILTSVIIGHGAIIAAGSVVTKDIPPYAIAGGVPCKVIKYRFDESTINKLLSLEWWNWPDDKIRDFIPLFLNKHKFSQEFLN